MTKVVAILSMSLNTCGTGVQILEKLHLCMRNFTFQEHYILTTLGKIMQLKR